MSGLKKYLDNDNYQNGLRVVLICILAVALVVGINLFAGLLPDTAANIDISTGHVFSISGDTEESLEELEKPVELIYVCEEGEENTNSRTMLELYADATDKVSLRQLDPAFDTQEIIKYIGETTLDNNSVIVTSGDRQQIVYYDDYYMSGSFVLEDYLNSAIRYVTGEEVYTVYFTEGHDESELDPSTIAYLGLDGFDYSTVSLEDAGTVPVDCRVLVINGPKSDISSEEANMILNFIKKGGSLVLTTDYSKSSFANLAKVTEWFGADKGNGVVMESDSNRYVNDNPIYVIPSVYTDNKVISEGVNYMILPNLSPIDYDEEDPEPSVSFTKLLEASENSYSVYTNILTGKGETIKGPFTVAALFEKGDGGSEGRMIWISSKFVSNRSVSEVAGGGNITFFLNSVNYLGKDEPAASIHGKKISSQYLDLTTAQLKFWEIIIPVVVPGAALLTGVIVMIRRKRR